MTSIEACAIPDGALLDRYSQQGAYADSFRCTIAATVTHVQFVEAFYTTWLFKLERFILKWAVARPSTDAQAAQLAAGTIDNFAAWLVEARATDQLLLTDFRGQTRSWLMVSPVIVDGAPHTWLYFGSAVVPVTDRSTGNTSLGPVFRALLGFHKLYSRALLSVARSRLQRENR